MTWSSEAESERPSATPAPAAIATPAATRPGEAQADEELRRLRIILRDNGDAVRRRGRAFLYGSLSYAALAVPGGIFLIANNPSPSERWGAGSFLIGSGAGLVVASLTNVVVTSDPDIVLEKKAKELEVEGGSSAEILARVDAAWEAQARDARSSRRSGAIFSIVFGSLAGAVGTTLELTLERRSDWNTLSPLLFGIGAADIGLGLYSLLVESPFETAHRTWKKARVPAPAAATVVRPSVAFAPLAGGGAISLGFAF